MESETTNPPEDIEHQSSSETPEHRHMPVKEDEDKETDEETKKDKKETTPGVVYLSRIPKKMNVKLIRDYFSQFGEVDRIYLEPREKKRKNEPRTFQEGWIEFKKRKVAKQVAAKLNNNQVGGKRRNPWYHELWNLKYLKNFRWTHLNERKAYEQELRKQKLRQDVAFAKKESNFYIQNFEKHDRRVYMEKKMAKRNEAEQNGTSEQKEQHLESENRKESSIDDNNQRNDEVKNNFSNKKHPLFERKVKVTGNDDFLKQIFS